MMDRGVVTRKSPQTYAEWSESQADYLYGSPEWQDLYYDGSEVTGD